MIYFNNSIIRGADYFLVGFGLLKTPGLRRYVILPLCINILLFVTLFFLFKHYFSLFNAWIATLLPHFFAWLAILLWFLFFISFFLFFIYAFIMLANIVCAPFNALLSEKVEVFLLQTLPPEENFSAMLVNIPRALKRQLAILFYYLPRALGFLVLFFIPIIHLVATPLWLLFNAWNMSLTYIDYPTDNHHLSFTKVRAWAWQRKWLVLGFGGSVLLGSMVPGLNFFVIPAAVAGATKLWLEENKYA